MRAHVAFQHCTVNKRVDEKVDSNRLQELMYRFLYFLSKVVVRVEGLEPPRLAAPEPKSGASTNFATPALSRHRRVEGD